MSSRELALAERFLKKHVYAVLGTSYKDQPHGTVVVYAIKDRDIYFFTGINTRKLKNMEENPQVSFVVEGRRFLRFPQAVEIIGRTEILSGARANYAQTIYFKNRRPEYSAAKMIARKTEVRWIKMIPEKIFTYGIGTKPWALDPEKQFRRIL